MKTEKLSLVTLMLRTAIVATIDAMFLLLHGVTRSALFLYAVVPLSAAVAAMSWKVAAEAKEQGNRRISMLVCVMFIALAVLAVLYPAK